MNRSPGTSARIAALDPPSASGTRRSTGSATQASALPGLSNAMASVCARDLVEMVKMHSTANRACPLRHFADAARRTRLPLIRSHQFSR